MPITVVSRPVIRQLCGLFAYEQGEQYCREGRVTIQSGEPAGGPDTVYEAEVAGAHVRTVRAALGQGERIEASCSCPDYYPGDLFCRHIAAVLFRIRELQEAATDRLRERLPAPASAAGGTSEAEEHERLIAGMLKLFGGQPRTAPGSRQLFETREPIDAEFTLTVMPCGFRKRKLALTLRIGQRRLYAVPCIRGFLDAVERGERMRIAKPFDYDPQQVSFRPADDALIRQLIAIRRSERIMRDRNPAGYDSGSHAGGDRALPVPPYAWDQLRPLLAACPSVRLEYDGRAHERLRLSEEPAPLRFSIAESPCGDGYVLDVEGLGHATILEDYGVVIAEGCLRRMDADACAKLAQLDDLLSPASGTGTRLRISGGHIGSFMQKVVPGLMALGRVAIDASVSDRILAAPLKARLYLDRVRDRLLAGLEFQYGGIVVNPVEAEGARRGESRILLRDGDKERRILSLMADSGMTRTESGFYLDNEEAEFDFLSRIVPELEKLLDVYATSAVKARIHPGPVAPKLTVNTGERTDWLEIRFDIDGIPEREIKRVLEALEEKRRYYRLPDGALLPLETSAFRDLVRFVNGMGAHMGGIVGNALRIPLYRALSLAEEGLPETVILAEPLRTMLDRLRRPDRLDHPVPERLKPVLRDYQIFGYQWMKTLAHYGFGGILADDMGLGKTLQSIAFLLSELPGLRAGGQQALIVCPASLVYNWANELARFAPELRVAIIDGSLPERKTALQEAAARADAVITSYPLLRRDAALYAGRTFHTLLLDEAQTIKNHATQTARAVKAIRSGYRFALTGTPIENRLDELWSISGAVLPGLFPARQAFNDLPQEAVAKRIRPFLLRRLKADVLKELPDKIESVHESALLPEQKKLYLAYLAKLRQETLEHLDEDRDGYRKNRIRILAGLTRLRQLCCHPGLFVEDYKGRSAKFEQLLEIVEDCRSAGKRMLVFSQFTGMLGMIARELGFRGVPYFYLDGQTPSSERIGLCDRFNAGEGDLFLISLKAGGTGLNLTGADTVILYDLWWNPAVEQQAADRAYRIGQKRVVHVLRLVARGTVEEKMFELQQRKLSLIDDVIRPGEEALSSLSEEEVREILSL